MEYYDNAMPMVWIIRDHMALMKTNMEVSLFDYSMSTTEEVAINRDGETKLIGDEKINKKDMIILKRQSRH